MCVLAAGTELEYLHASDEMISQSRLTMAGGGPCAGIGELDTQARRRAGEALARALPAAERIVLPGAGHLPNLDTPDAYNDVLRNFVRRQSLVAA